MILTILITIYILSFLRMYFWNKNAFNKDGVFDYTHPKSIDFIVTVIPVINTIFSFIVLDYSLTGKKKILTKSDSSDFSKFFNVKK